MARPTGALEGLRVLDTTGELGNYCGKLFADLGADVILVEPPDGVNTRRIGPYLDETPGPERSLTFAYLNTGKRSIVLDLADARDQETFERLSLGAHLVIDGIRPGERAALGFDPARLRQANPGLVTTSVTPFGLTGPYANWQADDLTLLALGGLLYLGGYHDGHPVAAYGHQASMAAGIFAAVASMAALYEAEVTGQGDTIEVAAQEVVVMAMENAVQFYEMEGLVRQRYGGDQRQAGAGVFSCRDGHIILLAGGIGANRFWTRFVAWMREAVVLGAEAFEDARWLDSAFLKTGEAKEAFIRIFGRFAQEHTKAELYAEGRQREIPLAPICEPLEIFDSPQLRYRDFFVDVWNSVRGDTIRMPGAPYHLSETPWQITRSAPALNEHMDEVLSDPAWMGEFPRKWSGG